MRLKTLKQRVVKVDDVKFLRAMETSDHIFFIDENEGDDSANTIMYAKSDLELVSNNYFANQSLIEAIIGNKATKIEKTFQYNYDEVVKENDTY